MHLTRSYCRARLSVFFFIFNHYLGSKKHHLCTVCSQAEMDQTNGGFFSLLLFDKNRRRDQNRHVDIGYEPWTKNTFRGQETGRFLASIA